MTTHHLQAGDFVNKTVRLVRPLAEGGMGRVWIAEHLGLNAEVVVKLMAPEMAERPDGAERFAREAAACAAIRSPHVVQVFDHGVAGAGADQGTPYMVMELLEGKDLSEHLAEHGRMAPLDVVALVVQVGKALSKAHKASIIHRDIKPENIFLCDTEGGEIFVKLLDFGTARRDVQATHRTTIPGQIMGTPYYMSPEQSVGASAIDERSDIWSLGVVAFEALTGHKPFDGPSLGAITIAIHGPLPRMTDILPELPPALDAWFARACALLPQDRFANVREATNAFAFAVTGATSADAPADSVFFPPTDAKNSIPVIAPVSRPIEPLIASLPERGSEKRFTTIAAGLVLAAAAAAMIAIVAGRPPPSAKEQAESMALVSEAPPPPSMPPTEPAAEAPPAEPSAVATPPPVASASLPDEGHKAQSASSLPLAKAAAARTRAKLPKPPRRGSRSKTNEGTDDDLVRLSNSAAKHMASAPPELVPPPESPAVRSLEEQPSAPALDHLP